MNATRTSTLVAMLVLMLGAVGCDKHTTSPSKSLPLGATASRSLASEDACGDLPTAPESQRVDLYTPSFSNPTRVTNPLFPISELDRVLLLGRSDGAPLRVETTLLPRTQTIRLNGRNVEALVSQYVAWLDRRILEVAIDWYVQDDQGAVWYLGEDVFNYEAGRVADREGTWLAGRDGPAAMIMPANPQVGDVWRPENICGFVFEEVTATATGVTVQGPRGPVSGALVVKELHMDGTFEDKTFAPGYGEFSTGSGDNLEAVALAVPVDALGGTVPDELKVLSQGAARIFRAGRDERWQVASATADAMMRAWAAYRARGVPPMLDAQMTTALDALAGAIGAREVARTRQASVDVSLATLDFKLRYRPRAEIDLALLDLWARQLIVDAEAGDRGAVKGDLVTIKWIRQRISGPRPDNIDARLDDLQAAAPAAELTVVAGRAERLRDALVRHVGDGETSGRQ